MLITTSQSLRYPNVRPGCNPDKRTFFVPIGKHQVFSKPTYLVLPKIYELPRQEVKNLLTARRITKKDPITPSLSFLVMADVGNFIVRKQQVRLQFLYALKVIKNSVGYTETGVQYVSNLLKLKSF
jgi:hypothetical protein